MKAIARIAAGILILTVASGCGGESKEADGVIARQRAYPRQELCDTVYKDCGLPAGFMVNAGAEAKDVTPSGKQSTPAQWVDISYPTYRATIHCTFMPVDDATRDAATANRMERMMLNIGDNFADQTELDSPGGFHSMILLTGADTPTPVQFLSVGERWVISGALQFADENVRTDSVMPILEAVRADLVYAAKKL